jgi:hypothetical protein
VTDYEIGGDATILYSSGEIMTWKKFSTSTTLVIHGFPGEIHETAFLLPTAKVSVKQLTGDSLQKSTVQAGVVTINYKITSTQTVLSIGPNLKVVIVNRNTAFDFWTPECDGRNVIVKLPYLVRSASFEKGGVLALKGDLNQTRVDAEVWVDDDVKSVSFNGKKVATKKTEYGSLKFEVKTGTKLEVELPSLQKLDWVRYDEMLILKSKANSDLHRNTSMVSQN